MKSISALCVCPVFLYFGITPLVGHIAFAALDDKSHSVHSYSINGSHLGSKYVSGRVTGLTTASDFLVVADDAGDVCIFGCSPIFLFVRFSSQLFFFIVSGDDEPIVWVSG